MKRSLRPAIALPVLVFSIPAIAAAGEIFDSPGPGYREQLERLYPSAKPADPALIHFGQFTVKTWSFDEARATFAKPIRLFESAAQPTAAPLLETPKPAAPARQR